MLVLAVQVTYAGERSRHSFMGRAWKLSNVVLYVPLNIQVSLPLLVPV